MDFTTTLPSPNGYYNHSGAGLDMSNTTDPCANHISNYSHDTSQTQLLSIVNVYYGIIYVVGMAGNLLVLYVVCRYSKMHTVTNFFILSMALADLCFLVNIPFLMVTTFKEKWIFGDLYCKIFYSMTTVNQFASSFFLMVMSADRYFAVCHPISSNRYRTARSAIIVCSIVWSTSIILMIPVFIYSGNFNGGNCGITWPGNQFMDDGMQAFTLYCTVLGFGFPLLLIVAFYTMVLRKLRTLGPKNVQGASEARKRSHRKVTIMVLAVIMAYIICWLPYWLAQVLMVFTNILFPPVAEGSEIVASTCGSLDEHVDPQTRKTITIVMVILQAFCYTNSSVNPILYAMLSENFKRSFAAACCGRRVELERMSCPEPSIYQRSRQLAGSIRRKFVSTYDDEDEEDSPEHTRKTDDPSTRPTTVNNSLQAPMTRNGSAKSATSASHAGNGNGYHLVLKQQDDEDAV